MRLSPLILSLFIFTSTLLPNLFAEDPLNVGGEIYKKKFENEKVRVLEFYLPKGASIAKHSHPDHFVYVLKGGTIKLSYADGNTKDIDAKEGEVLWIAAEEHSAENSGDTNVHALVVELKS